MTNKRHKLWTCWYAINQRCYNPNDPSYHRYGARGITNYWVDDRPGFVAYIYEHLGERPPNMSLDRINNDRGYEPGNLRWATRRTQLLNRTRDPISTSNIRYFYHKAKQKWQGRLRTNYKIYHLAWHADKVQCVVDAHIKYWELLRHHP